MWRLKATFVLLGALFVIQGPSLAQEARCALKLASKEVLQGLPICGVVSVTNTAGQDLALAGKDLARAINVSLVLRARGGQAKQCGGGASPGLEVHGGSQPLETCLFRKGETYDIMTRAYGIDECALSEVPSGTYEIYARATFSIADKEGLKYRPMESEAAEMAISEPQGEDLAYLRDAKKAFCSRLPCGQPEPGIIRVPFKWKDVVQPFPSTSIQPVCASHPTSTYAAYAVARQFGYPVSVPPLDKERMCRYLDKLQKDGRAELQDTTRHIATGPDGKELRDTKGNPVPLTQGEWLKETIDLAERVTAAHPELPVSEWIRSQIVASYYIQLLEFEKAAPVLDALKKSAKNPVIRQNSEQLLDILEEKGLVGK